MNTVLFLEAAIYISTGIAARHSTSLKYTVYAYYIYTEGCILADVWATECVANVGKENSGLLQASQTQNSHADIDMRMFNGADYGSHGCI